MSRAPAPVSPVSGRTSRLRDAQTASRDPDTNKPTPRPASHPTPSRSPSPATPDAPTDTPRPCPTTSDSCPSTPTPAHPSTRSSPPATGGAPPTAPDAQQAARRPRRAAHRSARPRRAIRRPRVDGAQPRRTFRATLSRHDSVSYIMPIIIHDVRVTSRHSLRSRVQDRGAESYSRSHPTRSSRPRRLAEWSPCWGTDPAPPDLGRGTSPGRGRVKRASARTAERPRATALDSDVARCYQARPDGAISTTVHDDRPTHTARRNPDHALPDAADRLAA